MSIQRYELSNWEDDGYELVQATDGEYMKYSDYAALEAQLAAVTAERDEARRVIAGDETDKDSTLAVLMTAAVHHGNGPCEIHRSHILNTLSRVERFKKQRDAATERAEKAEAYADYEKKQADRKQCPCKFGSPCHKRCTCANPGSSFGCRRCCSYGSPEQQAGMAKVLIENEQRAEKAKARAVAHWAECEAWRAWWEWWTTSLTSSPSLWTPVLKAREASDRARGEANPTYTPPTEGGENP